MRIVINCTDHEAGILRDALHNYYHETQPLKSPQAKNNGSFCKVVADRLKAALLAGKQVISILT